jgi:hypothetical protein
MDIRDPSNHFGQGICVHNTYNVAQEYGKCLPSAFEERGSQSASRVVANK